MARVREAVNAVRSHGPIRISVLGLAPLYALFLGGVALGIVGGPRSFGDRVDWLRWIAVVIACLPALALGVAAWRARVIQVVGGIVGGAVILLIAVLSLILVRVGVGPPLLFVAVCLPVVVFDVAAGAFAVRRRAVTTPGEWGRATAVGAALAALLSYGAVAVALVGGSFGTRDDGLGLVFMTVFLIGYLLVIVPATAFGARWGAVLGIRAAAPPARSERAARPSRSAWEQVITFAKAAPVGLIVAYAFTTAASLLALAWILWAEIPSRRPLTPRLEWQVPFFCVTWVATTYYLSRGGASRQLWVRALPLSGNAALFVGVGAVVYGVSAFLRPGRELGDYSIALFIAGPFVGAAFLRLASRWP